MPRVIKENSGLWAVSDDDGTVLICGLTNSHAWRELMKLENEKPIAKRREVVNVASEDEQQEFYSGLLSIADKRGYKSGWAWHKFHEKFGHIPDGLRDDRIKPTKAVWGWVNRHAIKASKR